MLTIIYNGTDLSTKLEEFALPLVPITLLVTEKVSIGYLKPITNFYVELNNSVDSLSNITINYASTSGTKEVSNMIDKTNGLGNSGRVSWDAPTDIIMSAIGGKSLYWYELSVNVVTEERNFVGINVLFSDDKDLEEEYPGILEELPEEATSFVNFHASARKDIVQYLRKNYSTNSGLLNAYDLLNNAEVKQASKYLALSKVMGWLSEKPDDKWAIKGPVAYSKYIDFINSVNVTIDADGDGQEDEDEKTSTISFVRLVRV